VSLNSLHVLNFWYNPTLMMLIRHSSARSCLYFFFIFFHLWKNKVRPYSNRAYNKSNVIQNAWQPEQDRREAQHHPAAARWRAETQLSLFTPFTAHFTLSHLHTHSLVSVRQKMAKDLSCIPLVVWVGDNMFTTRFLEKICDMMKFKFWLHEYIHDG